MDTCKHLDKIFGVCLRTGDPCPYRLGAVLEGVGLDEAGQPRLARFTGEFEKCPAAELLPGDNSSVPGPIDRF